MAAIQFRTNQYADSSVSTTKIADAAVTQPKHSKFLGHVARVDYSMMISDNVNTPPGSPDVGDTYIVGSSPTGAWTGKAGYVVEWDGALWLEHAVAITSGRRCRVAPSSKSPSGSFASKPNFIMEKTATGYDEFDPSGVVDGMQAIQEGISASFWDKDVYLWNNQASAWVSIAESISIDSDDNALQIVSGVLGHVEQMGHGVEPVDYYVYSDKDQGTADPAAATYANHMIIMNNTTSYTDGDVYYSDGTSWVQLTTSPLTTGARIATEPTVEAGCGLVSGSFQVNTTGTFGSASDWDITQARAGDILFCSDPAQNTGTTAYEKITAIWDGSAWNPIAKWEATGDGIAFSATADYYVKRQNGGGLNFDGSGNLIIDAQSSSGYPNEPTASDPLVTLTKVQSLLSGWNWKEPAQVLKMVSDASQGGSPPGMVSSGDAYVVNSWGVGYNDGDIVEAAPNLSWVVIVSNSGGEPPDGTRIIVGPNGAGSFAGHAGDIATYDAVGDSWSFYDPEDGDGILINGEGGLYENQQYVYDVSASPSYWVQVGAQVVYTAGNGIDVTGTVISADVASDGAIIATGGTGAQLEVQLESSDPTLQINGSNELGVKLGDGVGATSSGLAVDFVQYDDAVTSAEEAAGYWDITGSVGTLVVESAMVFREGQKLTRDPINNPPTVDGYWYWDSTNKRVVFKAAYIAEGDNMTIWALET